MAWLCDAVISRWHPPILFAVLVSVGLIGSACGSDDGTENNDIDSQVTLANAEARGQIQLCITNHGTPVWNYDQFSDRYDYLGCIARP